MRSAAPLGLLLSFSACSKEPPFFQVEVSSNTAIIFGGESFISTDSGETWNCLDSPVASHGDSLPRFQGMTVSRVGSKDFYAIREGQLFVSKNAGETWHSLPPLPEVFFRKVHFFELQRGLALVVDLPGFRNQRVLWTRDGGQTWAPLADATFFRDAVHDESQVLYLDASNAIQRSNDRGETWQTIGKCGPLCYSLSLIGDEVWMLGREGFCRRLHLETLQEISCGFESDLWILDVAARGRSLLAGASEGTLLISTDKGKTWVEEQLDSSSEIVSVGFFGDGTAIAVGGQAGELYFPVPSRIAALSKDLRNWKRASFPPCP